MNIEQKAKAYDKALEMARKELLTCGSTDCETARQIYRFFPELKEGEDERIRKTLIEYFNAYPKDYYCELKTSCIIAWLEKQGKKPIWHNEDEEPQRDSLILLIMQSGTPIVAKIIEPNHTFNHGERWAYIDDLLEKQGEQKPVDFKAENFYVSKVDGQIHDMTYNPADKVEPKFHEGEWITNGDYTWKIVEVELLDYILQSQDGNIVDDTISHVDEQFHSFTIEDAKPCDVLASELCDSIILFRGIKDDNIDFYCDYDFSKIDIPEDRFSINDGQHYGNIEDSKDFHPATKEQRDTLMKAMADAGYTFDFEKKELKKIDSPVLSNSSNTGKDEPTKWSEEDKKVLEDIEEAVINYWGGDTQDIILGWLKSLKQRIGG